MDKQTSKDVQFTVKRVKDTYFSVNEDLYRGKATENVKFELQYQLATNKEENSLKFTLICNVRYTDDQDPFAVIHVVNVFDVPAMKENVEDSFAVPFILQIVNLSVSHARALLSKNLSGTVYDAFILPVIDTVAIAKQFFPDIPINPSGK